MDQIIIKNLEIYANHGVFPEETTLGQKFLVNATLMTNTRKAGLLDDLKESIDYGEICHKITKFLKQNTFQLLEAAAEQLAQELLHKVLGLEKIELEIKKPWAPIGLPVKYVSVKITRSWHKAYLALGSNLGDKEKYLMDAIAELRKVTGIRVEKVSSFLVTEPYGGVEQEEFLNGCMEISTTLTPMELLRKMNEIEEKAGRVRTIHWGPRTLDLDILFYDDLVTEDPVLLIPHIDLENRTFVLKPLMELCPYKRHPVSGKTMKELLESLERC